MENFYSFARGSIHHNCLLFSSHLKQCCQYILTCHKGKPGPVAQCDSVFNRQNKTRKYFCMNYHASMHETTQFDKVYRHPQDAISDNSDNNQQLLLMFMRQFSSFLIVNVLRWKWNLDSYFNGDCQYL